VAVPHAHIVGAVSFLTDAAIIHAYRSIQCTLPDVAHIPVIIQPYWKRNNDVAHISVIIQPYWKRNNSGFEKNNIFLLSHASEFSRSLR